MNLLLEDGKGNRDHDHGARFPRRFFEGEPLVDAALDLFYPRF